MLRISPSILACDFSQLGEEVKKVENAGVEYLHIDVMDGVFVPNISLGPVVISSIRKISKLFFDVHLMIVNPQRYIEEFQKAGADNITIHYESCEDHKKVLQQIKALGIKAGISIKPATPAFVLEPLLEYVDMVLVMTVEPGFGGQSFLPETLHNVKEVADMIQKKNLSVDIEVDGGITASNVALATQNGANVIVAGSAIFKAPDTQAAVDAIRRNANGK